MTRVLLVRHAPTAETGHKLTGRLPGVSLGEPGQEMARRTAAKLAGTRVDVVYSSPIERTWETAVEIATPHRLEPVADDGLLEVDYGSWSGRTLKSLYPLKAWRTVQETPSRMTFPGGESIQAVQGRSVETCERIVLRHPRATVAMVTHGDVIRCLVAHFLGTPLDLFQRIVISPASVTVIDLPRRGTPRVVAVNTDGEPATWR